MHPVIKGFKALLHDFTKERYMVDDTADSTELEESESCVKLMEINLAIAKLDLESKRLACQTVVVEPGKQKVAALRVQQRLAEICAERIKLQIAVLELQAEQK